jgi:quinolinate synthase
MTREKDVNEIKQSINAWRVRRRAVILAHYYQWPEVQDAADFVGDSLDLSRKACAADAEVIVFCGVYFMAESAKILSPHKTVLLPVLTAGCPMADMITPEHIAELRRAHPDAAVVTYVNSSAAVKAVSDICCTSSNAVAVVRSRPESTIIFGPDRNLGHFISLQVPEKRFVFHDGFCPTHERITVEDVRRARAEHPDAALIVHPECRPDVVRLADFAGSTAQLIRYARESERRELVIGTEQGVLHPMQQQNPDKQFHLLNNRLICGNMKKCFLEHVLGALVNMEHRIELDDSVIDRAAGSLTRMLAIG